ncbi:uncharacterized protein [Pyrus communis]|uniref:uncharacterized protein n=1 Tax=Pyrus communis TaxID=23211 RepID=UPI0035BFA16B
MGKSTADLPVQGLGQDLHPAKKPIIVAPPEATSATRRENEIYLGGQPHNSEVPNQIAGIFVEGIVEDCDDDGGEGSDPPTRSFLRRRLDEQYGQVEQSIGQNMNDLLEAIRNNNDTQTKILELLVSKAFEDGQVGQPRQLSTNVPIQAERGSARPQPITLDKRGGQGNRSEGPNQGEEATSVNMTEVQRMIDSALKKGPKFPKFIHPYPAYVERFEYPRGFKIPDFILFAGESSLSSLEHVARFTAQCGDVNSDFYKLRLFNFSLTGSAFAWYINLPPNSVQSWEELVEKFHEQFYQPGMEMSVSSLTKMA